MVQSISRVPWGMEPEAMKDLGAKQGAKAKELRERGVCVHHWRAAGEHLAYAVYDVASNAELQEILTSMPLYPYTEAKVVPLLTPG